MNVPVICPSKGRAGRVLTLNAVEPLILCVGEEEKDIYHKEYPDVELMVHPDEVLGETGAHKWIHEQVGDMFIVDDDLVALVQTYDPELPSREPPKHAYDIIQMVGDVARDVGVYLWGLANSHDARYYNANRPFRLSGYQNGYAFGLFAGSRIPMLDDPTFTMMDYYYSGMNAFYHRKVFCDTRWGFQQLNTFRGTGGLSEWRNTETERRCTERLIALFGEAVVPKVKASTAGHSRHDNEKLLKIPW